MMTRRQLHELALVAGLLLALLSYCFATEELIRWWPAAPLIAVGIVLFIVGVERRRADKRRCGR